MTMMYINNAVEDGEYAGEVDGGDDMLDNGGVWMNKRRVFYKRLFEYFLFL